MMRGIGGFFFGILISCLNSLPYGSSLIGVSYTLIWLSCNSPDHDNPILCFGWHKVLCFKYWLKYHYRYFQFPKSIFTQVIGVLFCNFTVGNQLNHLFNFMDWRSDFALNRKPVFLWTLRKIITIKHAWFGYTCG